MIRKSTFQNLKFGQNTHLNKAKREKKWNTLHKAGFTAIKNKRSTDDLFVLLFACLARKDKLRFSVLCI